MAFQAPSVIPPPSSPEVIEVPTSANDTTKSKEADTLKSISFVGGSTSFISKSASQSETSSRAVTPEGLEPPDVPNQTVDEGGEKFIVTQTREMKRKGITLPRGWQVRLCWTAVVTLTFQIRGTRREAEARAQGQVYSYFRIDWTFQVGVTATQQHCECAVAQCCSTHLQAPDGRSFQSLKAALAAARHQARQVGPPHDVNLLTWNPGAPVPVATDSWTPEGGGRGGQGVPGNGEGRGEAVPDQCLLNSRLFV